MTRSASFSSPRLDDAGRGHGVLGLQGGHQRLPVDAQARHLLGRELDEDFFVLRTYDLDLGHVRHLQQARAHVLDVVLQLAMAEAVRRETVDDAVGVAELVVEAGPDDALWQGVADVADLLADLIPDVRDRLARGRAVQVDEDRALARAGVAAQIIEVGRLLSLRSRRSVTCWSVSWIVAPGQLACTTMVRIVKAGSSLRPRRRVRADARNGEHEHEEDDERAVPDRPFREVEAAHDNASEQAHLLARAQRLHASRDHDLAGLQPLGDHHAVRLVPSHIDVA